jgi:hypothetical protein
MHYNMAWRASFHNVTDEIHIPRRAWRRADVERHVFWIPFSCSFFFAPAEGGDAADPELG